MVDGADFAIAHTSDVTLAVEKQKGVVQRQGSS